MLYGASERAHVKLYRRHYLTKRSSRVVAEWGGVVGPVRADGRVTAQGTGAAAGWPQAGGAAAVARFLRPITATGR